MLATETCPICGSARTGSFRFCRSCGLDYDPAEGSASGADAAAAASAPPSILASEPHVAPELVALPGSGGASATTTPTEAAPATSSDVIVIQKRHIRMAVGALAGGLIGAMIAGALVVPLLGEALVALGAVATIAIIALGGVLGARVAGRTA